MIYEGDRVRIINVKTNPDDYDHPKELIGLEGVVDEVDLDWEYPYHVNFITDEWVKSEIRELQKVGNGYLWLEKNLKVL